jgi:hypothetical protein
LKYEQPRHIGVQEREIQLLLPLEVLIEDRLGHAGALRDLLHRCAWIPVLCEYLSGHREKLRAARFSG